MHTTSPATRRALAGTVMVLALLAGLSACSGDDGESAPTTTESAQPEDGVEVTESTIPLSTVPDDEFANVVDGLSAQIESAPDSCALLSIIFNAGSLPTPSNTQQTEAAGTFLASVLRRLAESPPPGQEANAATLATAADELIAEGEASGWDPATISNPSAITNDVQNALGSYASACPELTDAAGGAGAPSDEPAG